MNPMKIPSRYLMAKWKFRSISLQDRARFEAYIQKSTCPINLWSTNFAYMWAAYSNNRKQQLIWKKMGGMIVPFLLRATKHLSLYSLPFGEGDADKVSDVVYEALIFCKQWNIWMRTRNTHGQIRVISSEQLQFLQKSLSFPNRYGFNQFRGIEWHANIGDLLALRGKDFKNIRQKLNQFQRRFPQVMIRPYQSGDFEQTMKLYDHWLKNSGKKYQIIYDHHFYPRLLKYTEELGQRTLIAELNGEIIAVAGGSIYPNSQSWASIGKEKEGYEGLSEMMVIEFAKEINRLNPAIEWMNLGSDLGEKGLREYKEKFRPQASNRYGLYLR